MLNVKLYGNIKVKWEIRKGVLKLKRADGGGAAMIQTQLFTLNKKDVIRVLENNLLNSQMSSRQGGVYEIRNYRELNRRVGRTDMWEYPH